MSRIRSPSDARSTTATKCGEERVAVGKRPSLVGLLCDPRRFLEDVAQRKGELVGRERIEGFDRRHRTIVSLCRRCWSVTLPASRRSTTTSAGLDDGSIFRGRRRHQGRRPCGRPPTGRPIAVVDARGCIVIPGLVNTHHHFYQTLTRAVPGNAGRRALRLADPALSDLGPPAPEALRSATRGLPAPSCCSRAAPPRAITPTCGRTAAASTTRSRSRARSESAFMPRAARCRSGVRTEACPPDDLVESGTGDLGRYPPRDRSLSRSCALCDDAHRRRAVLAVSVSPELMRESLALARSYGVHAHTHLAETLDEERFCLERFGHRPVGYAEHLGWLGEDVWHAHMVHPFARRGAPARCDPDRRCRTARPRTCVWQRNRALARAHRSRRARSGSGSTGRRRTTALTCSTKCGTRCCCSGVGGGAKAANAREILRVADARRCRRVGARRRRCARARNGRRRGRRRSHTARVGRGAVHDPLAALVLCRPPNVDFTIVNGRVLVERGAFTTFDVERITLRHNELARELVSGG